MDLRRPPGGTEPGVAPAAVRLTVVAASLLLVFEITSYTEADITTAVDALSAALATPESANTIFAGTGIAVDKKAPRSKGEKIVGGKSR